MFISRLSSLWVRWTRLSYNTHSFSFCFGVSTVQVAERSWHTSDTKRYATRVIGTSLKGSIGQNRARTSKMRDKGCSQKVRCTFLKIQSSCQSEGNSSGCQVALGKGPWHFCVYKVRLQLPLAFHVNYSSTRARVPQRLEDEACLLGDLETHDRRRRGQCLGHTASGGHLTTKIKSQKTLVFFDPFILPLRNWKEKE